MKHIRSITRGLGKKTKCSIAGHQLASDSTAKQTKRNASAKLNKCKK